MPHLVTGGAESDAVQQVLAARRCHFLRNCVVKMKPMSLSFGAPATTAAVVALGRKCPPVDIDANRVAVLVTRGRFSTTVRWLPTNGLRFRRPRGAAVIDALHRAEPASPRLCL